jgi:hypothetical protein
MDGPEHENTNGESDGDLDTPTEPGAPGGAAPGAERDTAEGDRTADLPAGAETA